MTVLRGAWKVLMGVKDALVLIFMLLFFGAIYAALTATPGVRPIGNGALLLDLKGSIVEQPAEADPFEALASAAPAGREYRLRDVVQALDSAATDDRVKAVVLDLDRFTGGGQVALETVGQAIRRVRDAKKPVLAYATGYSDSAYLLAANASEIWLNPFGLTAFTGPGGSRLYYKGLIDRLGITTHVYRVGQFKSAVEPYTRADQSPEARRANEALAGALWEGWQKAVAAARPQAKIAGYVADPVGTLLAQGGDMAKAAQSAGLVDKLGDRVAFGRRVAEIAGGDTSKPAGTFKTIHYDDWVSANPPSTGGDAIGVLTVAGVIVDGKASPGTAGGETISKLLYKGLADNNLKALVVRVDSPGGSVLASEQIRTAVLDARKAGLPVVISMGSVAASGGYWVATAGDTIFAEPSTITGSIGVFGVLPTLENALAKVGVTTDGVATTPLSGQPDLFGGTTPQFDQLMQAGVEDIYRKFTGLVAQARKLPVARVDEIGQGRVWDGGSARQLGLVDNFGSLDAAIADAARRAKLDPAKVHAVYLEKQPSFLAAMLKAWTSGGDDEDAADASVDLLTRMGQARNAVALTALADARMLASGPAIQVRCLECGTVGGVAVPARTRETLLAWAIERFLR